MKTITVTLFLGLFFNFLAASKSIAAGAANPSLAVNEIRYDARLANEEARFKINFDVEAAGAGESAMKILEGDVAVLPSKLPDGLKIIRDGSRYQLVAPRAGRYRFALEVVAKIQSAEPWNRVLFTGPAATIASVNAQAAGTNTDVQLLTGTLLEAYRTNGVSGVKGFLGADQTVSLRWSREGGIAAVARKALLTADSDIAVLVTPAVVKYTSRLHFDIVQGSTAQLTLSLPASQALTRLEGEQIRDWHTSTKSGIQTLTVEFIKPLERACDLTLYSEQTVENSTASMAPPQPLGVERESGALTVSAEDTLVEIATVTGLRQVNAPGNAIAAYHFNARPFTLALKLKRIEPVITVADRVSIRLEESRLIVAHSLALNVEKSGIYSLELSPQPGFTVADVRGAGLEDWNVSGGKLTVNFAARVLGPRPVDVQLEMAQKQFPEQINIAPLRVAGAAKESSQIGAAAVPGIRLKTGSISGLREVPLNYLSPHPDEILAYTAELPDWQLAIGCEKLAARVVADIFNLVTIGDGMVGGSAAIRYGLVNQGVQEFKVRVPAGFKNVEFTGPNIRRKEQSGDTWTIGLQDKVWGGYTLVVTYDYQFDPKGATLPVGGIHAVDVERETGSIAITTAASLQLEAKNVGDALRRVDESELPAADRSLVTRAVVLAWQYGGGEYDLSVDVKRFAEERVLEAVADRTQITSVLTEAGEMLTQASFMVKNNEKQFQRFQLPKDARLWGCYVNGQPAKPSRDGDWVLVSLPRDANRDQAFAVDIMYAQTNGALASTFGKNLLLNAPRTDVPNTYAEWQVFVPPTLRLSDFGGSMSVTRGTTYELLDAWDKFLAFYGQVLREAGAGILIMSCLALLVFALVVSAVRRGWNGVITLLGVFVIVAVLGAMLLPALSAAKSKAQRINSVNNLKQIGLAARLFSGDNGDRLPMSFEEMKNELGTDKVTYDPATGQRYVYLGAGMSLNNLKPDSVLAYSTPDEKGRCDVLFADGSVQMMDGRKFAALSQRGLVQLAGPQAIAEKQREALARAQMTPDNPPPAAAPALEGAGSVVSGSEPQAINFPAQAGQSEFAPLNAGTKPVAPDASVPPPVVAGIRSIRIELPQTGQPFLFTKVLNVHGDPLSIRARVIPLHTFQTFQMVWQSAAFLLGVFVWWMQWHRSRRNTFILTLALALIIGSVCSLLIQWRALHDALIIGFPMAAVSVIAFLVWKYWPRAAKSGSAPEPPSFESSAPEPGTPPVLAAIALTFVLSLTSATADDSAIRNPQSAFASASITSVTYSGTANDRVALLDARIQFSAVKSGDVVPLFGDDVAVQQFVVKSGGASLVRQDGGIAVRFDRKGNAILQVKMLVKISGDVTKRRLAFAIPPALSSQVSLALDEAGADIDFPGAVSLKRILHRDQTRVEAVLGCADRLELLWTPRVKRAEEVAATVFCRNTALVAFGGGAMNIRATLDYQITQGEVRHARVLLPAGQRLLHVEGKEIRTWEIKNENGAQILVVDMLKGVPLNWQLQLETEKIISALPADETIVLPQALDVKREHGLIALRTAEELSLSVDSSTGLERVDAQEFLRSRPESTDGLFSAFRFANPDFALKVRAEAVQPQIEAVVRNHFRVGTAQASLSAVVNYTIKRAGVFSLHLSVPDGWRVERVKGDNIQQWTEIGAPVSDPARLDNETTVQKSDHAGPEAGAPARILNITLKDRTSGGYTLVVDFSRSFQELPRLLSVAGVEPIDAAKLTGFVTVSAEPGVSVKTESFEGLIEIPASGAVDATTASAANLLAFKFISTQPKTLPGWSLKLATENVAAWVRAEIVNSFTLTETLVNGRAIVRYDIANGPVKELFLRIPAEFRNVEIGGANIRSKEHDNSVWRVKLQNAVYGSYALTVTWDQPRPANTNALVLAGVSAGSVERETGYFAVFAKPSLQVSELHAEDLQRVDAADLPDWAGVSGSATTLAYRYLRPGSQLSIDVRRFDDAAVLEALVDSAHFTSVVADDGQMMTELSLLVHNNGRQFLEIELPADAKVWSAFVAGQPVRPSVRGGKYLLPIESSGASDGATTVELTYVGTNRFPKVHGEIGFVSPKFDVPVKDAHWEVYLPPDYDYLDLQKGTMTRKLSPASEPLSASFSILDYSRMEQANKESAKVEMERDVTVARQQLAGGNVRDATANFNRVMAKSSVDKNADVKKLGDELKYAQASNLINAQNEFFFHSRGQMAAGGTVSGQSQGNFDSGNSDIAAAGEQWMKLQQAQEIVTTKVQPLHVNLPVRGQRLAFVQVLQTEGGKPMTFQLAATNTKTVHWPSRLAAVAATFLALWGMVAVLSRVTQKRGAH